MLAKMVCFHKTRQHKLRHVRKMPCLQARQIKDER
nr:MAG TPA: hypothetical protein [Caudoviricetes sp.]